MKTELEKCVFCGKTTNVPVDTPIELRQNYVEGAGQLCAKCMAEVNSMRDEEEDDDDNGDIDL